MLNLLIALSLVFGVVIGEPLARISSNDVYELLIKPDLTPLILNGVTSLMGYKTTALSLAVSLIGWLVSNVVYIVYGAIATFGLCKLFDKCFFISNFGNYEPLLQLQTLATPERLEVAEKFLVDAVEKYAHERRRTKRKRV